MSIGGGDVDGRGGGEAEELVNDPGPFFGLDFGMAPLLLPGFRSDRSDEVVLRPDPLMGCCGWKLELADEVFAETG